MPPQVGGEVCLHFTSVDSSESDSVVSSPATRKVAVVDPHSHPVLAVFALHVAGAVHPVRRVVHTATVSPAPNGAVHVAAVAVPTFPGKVLKKRVDALTC